jgi:translation initiation factor IF-3
LGVLNRAEAKKLADERELDLVLIAGAAKPPVVKLIDFKKFLYQESKKLQEARKGVKKSTIKDVKLSLFIGKGDLDRLIKRAQEFLEDGQQVRISLLLKGREMGKRDMAFNLVSEYIKAVGDVNVSTTPKMQGRVVLAVITKKK